tara:strand:+ start:14234 stop:14929 length:696 start_codon:yes stop_codon:yes gene_type:complete
MIQTSINAIIGLQLKKFIPNKQLLLTSLIMGMLLPDLDLILDFILSLFLKFDFLNNPYISNTIFHSLFMIPFISLLTLIYLEYKNKNNINIVMGLSIGMFIHVIFDILTLKSVGIFYPLFDSSKNINLNNSLNFNIPDLISKTLYAFEFFFFRLYTWMNISLIIINKNDSFKILKKLTIWMKFQLYIFLLFLLLIYFDIDDSVFSNFFGIFYIPSFLMAVYMTYKTRKAIK